MLVVLSCPRLMHVDAALSSTGTEPFLALHDEPDEGVRGRAEEACTGIPGGGVPETPKYGFDKRDALDACREDRGTRSSAP